MNTTWVTPPPLPKTVTAPHFQRLLPRISVAMWSLWFLIGIGFALRFYAHAEPNLGLQTILAPLISLGLKGGAITIGVLLCKQPNRGLAFFLAAICIYGTYRFFLGDVIVYMLPSMGGLSFSGALADWWWRNMTTIGRFITTVPFCIFVVLSAFCWPIYAICYGTEKA